MNHHSPDPLYNLYNSYFSQKLYGYTFCQYSIELTVRTFFSFDELYNLSVIMMICELLPVLHYTKCILVRVYCQKWLIKVKLLQFQLIINRRASPLLFPVVIEVFSPDFLLKDILVQKNAMKIFIFY